MQQTDPTDIVEGYLQAFGERDSEMARTYLADRGFSFVSPISHFDDADAFAQSLDAVGAILERMRIRHRFAAGDVVCHVLDVTVAMASYQTQTVIHLAQLERGRIRRLEVIFDATEYNRMIGDQS